MNRGNFPKDTADAIREESEILEEVGYYSVLLTYHSKQNDVLLSSFLAANKNHKLKYMIAMRTYSISPEYLHMIYRSYNSKYPNKLMFNICSGDIHANETSIDDLVYLSDDLDTPEKRLLYTKEWIKKFKKIAEKDLPELVMSGHSEATNKMADENGFANISMLDMYKKEINFRRSQKHIVSLSVLIRDSKDEAFNFIKENASGGALNWTIYGTREEVKEELLNLSNLGVTDILISQTQKDEKVYLVHDLIREIIKNNG
jgi:alkanesulfonate monooxygenase SsuD/methylene tetrahydromethanopterin reductase-like flavin-dependent oxidoreductase (luciferase family)